MATDLIEINVDAPSANALHRAADIIRKGGVVAIPTDALYTLVADPMNLHAVGHVYAAKGREVNRALPLLISGNFMAENLSKELSNRYYVLARHFWPGPLTMIVPASANVPLKVTGNTGRLAIRQSRSKVAQALLEYMEQPLISTSANISGQPTGSSGIEVFAQMDGRVALVLDGGMCTSQGSTTVDITEPYWRVIKEGAISERDIAECLKGQKGGARVVITFPVMAMEPGR